jgi:glycine cleavage system regulatory protein/CheY-like chemotaxis protein
MSWERHHYESERLASAAETAVRRGDGRRASELYKLAAESEKRALNEIDPSKLRTLGVTAVSAAALYYKAGEYETAYQIAQRWLYQDSFPSFAREQLREILQKTSDVLGSNPEFELTSTGTMFTPHMGAVLLADNDRLFLEVGSESLTQAGYKVFKAETLQEAERLLNEEYVQVAILDLRLEDDADPKDESGLELAKKAEYRLVPKIILINYPAMDIVREALAADKESGLPAVEFVQKQEGPEALIEAVERTISRHAPGNQGFGYTLASANSTSAHVGGQRSPNSDVPHFAGHEQQRFIKVSGIGRDQPGISYRIAKMIRRNGGNILLQRSMQVAGEFALTVIASFDKENQAGQLKVLQSVGKDVLADDFIVFAREIEMSSFAPKDEGGTKYVVTVAGDDQAGIVESITLLLLQNNLNLTSMESEVAARPFQGTPTFSSKFDITVPDEFDMDAFIEEIEQLEKHTDLTILIRPAST